MKSTLENLWMPFTANRQFKQTPRMLVSANGLYYTSEDGRTILDGTSGLWCSNAGHCHPHIQEVVSKQLSVLDYAPSFQMGHPAAFALASRLSNYFPTDMNKVFFTNSGSESVETALKIAVSYQKAIGQEKRVHLIGRERGYHGVNFGGISVGGIPPNRDSFGDLLPSVDHIKHTHDISRNAFSRGMPEYGAEYAEDLLRVINLYGAETIAALIIEPVAGSTGVLIPPKGYLERIREICDENGILLIFDEVITGFGRLGVPFAVDYFGVIPDIVTTAKGLTNATVPMGAVICKDFIYDAFMSGAEHLIEFFHGYTYSGNPVACAAAMACLDVYESEQLFSKDSSLTHDWQEMLHSFKGLPYVIDIRNLGFIGAIELEPIEGMPTKRAFSAFIDAFESGLLIRTTGDIIALSPPLPFEKENIDELGTILREVLLRLK
jgi:beta-alanine--pyruvate transaminase